MAQTKNPRQELNEFYQRFKKVPDYQTEAAPCEDRLSRFICNLTCPGVEKDGEGFSEQIFQGEGKGKKEAMSNAAAEAVSFLRGQSVFNAAKPYDESFWSTLNKVCSREGLRKDPEIEGYILLTQQFADGWMPLSCLTQSRILRGWFKEYCPHAVNDHLAMVKVMKQRLEAEKQQHDNIAAGNIVLSPNGLSLKCKEPYLPPTDRDPLIQNVVEDPQLAAVVVPADHRAGVREVSLPAEGLFLDHISSMLGCSTSQVVMWGRVGHKAHYVAHPSQMTAQQQRAGNPEPAGPLPEAEVTDATAVHSSSRTSHSDRCSMPPPADLVKHNSLATALGSTATVVMDGPAAMDWAGNDAANSEVRGPAAPEPAPSVTSLEEDQHGGHAVPVPQPSLYTVYVDDTAAAPLNIRASWVVGRPVHGDVVLSLTRMSPNQVGRFVVKWRSYPEVDFWRTVNAGFPAAAYPKSLHSAVVARLPAEYRHSGGWAGPNPKSLLEAYCSYHSWRCTARYEATVTDADDPDSAVVTLEVTPATSAEPLRVTAGPCSTAETAHQRAALAMLHCLQAVDVAVLSGLDPPAAAQLEGTVPPREQRAKHIIQLASGVEVLQRGEFHSRHVEPGAHLKVHYRVYIPREEAASMAGMDSAEAEEYLVERRENFGFELGSGSVLPELEAAATCLMAGGSAQCRALIALEGSDPLGRMPRVPCMLWVQLAHVTPAGREAGVPQERGPKIFEPSLGLQRYQFVCNLAAETQAEMVVDLGCGEGRLLEHIIRHAPFTPLRRLVGVEINAEAVVSAAKRLAKTVERVPILRDAPPDAAVGEGGALAPAAAAAGMAATPAVAATTSQESVVAATGPPPPAVLGASPPTGAVVAPSDESVAAAAFAAGLTGAPATMSTTCGNDSVMLEAAESVEGSTTGNGETDDQQAAAAASRTINDGVDSWHVVVEVMQGSIAADGLESPAGWGDVAGCGLAACVEVIEHLDPEPLAMLGPAILGGLRPKVATVTTPNWEYNKVLRAMEDGAGWPGSPGRDGLPLRCADHRFEWTRSEFEEWARTQAAAFGYSVRFEGIGRAIREEEVLAAPGYTGPKDVGCATQAAIFTRGEPWTPGDAEALALGLACPLLPMVKKDIWAVMGDLQEGASSLAEAPEGQAQEDEKEEAQVRPKRTTSDPDGARVASDLGVANAEKLPRLDVETI